MWLVWYLMGIVHGMICLFLYAAISISGAEARKEEALDAKYESVV